MHYCSDSMKMAVDACEKISEFLTNSNSYIQGNWFKGNVSESTLLEVGVKLSNKKF